MILIAINFLCTSYLTELNQMKIEYRQKLCSQCKDLCTRELEKFNKEEEEGPDNNNKRWLVLFTLRTHTDWRFMTRIIPRLLGCVKVVVGMYQADVLQGYDSVRGWVDLLAAKAKDDKMTTAHLLDVFLVVGMKNPISSCREVIYMHGLGEQFHCPPQRAKCDEVCSQELERRWKIHKEGGGDKNR